MDFVSGLLANEAVQQVRGLVQGAIAPEAKPETKPEPAKDGDFEGVLKGLLNIDPASNVNEEELFAALIFERLQKLKGDELANQFKTTLEERKIATQRPDGVQSVEQSANEALAGLVTSGALTSEEADTVKSEAFAAAQLDDNLDSLYDGRGSEGDPTIAVMALEAALMRAKLKIEEFESGATPPPLVEGGDSPQLATEQPITANGTHVDGAGGFLFKPESESDGNLVILLPSDLAHKVTEVVLKDEAGSEVGRGVSRGYGNPDDGGEREHFRFSKPGGDYGANLTVEVKLQDGSLVQYIIPNTAERND